MPEYRIEVPLRTQRLKYHNPLVLAQDGAALEATDKLSRNYWIISKVYGDGHYDVQKESAKVYEFNYQFGSLESPTNSFSDQTKYEYVFCIIPRAVKYLGVGDVVKLGFYHNNKEKPFIKQIVKSFKGQEPITPVPSATGLWNRTWGNPYQSASSKYVSVAVTTLDSTLAFSYETEDTLAWQPEGLLAHKAGGLIYVSRYIGTGETPDRELHVRLLDTSTSPYTVKAFHAIPLEGPEITATFLYPDGTVFYDEETDIVTVLIGPSWSSWGFANARVWSGKLNSDLTAFNFHATTEFELAVNGGYPNFGWSMVTSNGKYMAMFSYARELISIYELNTSTLQWSQTSSQSVSYGTWGLEWTGPGVQGVSAGKDRIPRRNYSPPCIGNIAYSLVTTRDYEEESGDFIELRLRELAVDMENNSLTEVDLVQLNETSRTEPAPLELDICNSWAAGYFANTFDEDFPESGDYDTTEEGSFSNFISNGFDTGDERYEEAEYEWTEFKSRRWLGCAFTDFTHTYEPEFAWGGDPETILTPGYSSSVGGVPLMPAGLPTLTPNRAWWGRCFWTGQRPSPREWAGEGPIPSYAVTSDARALTTPDGWRYYITLVPKQPVWVPATTYGDKYVNRGHFTYERGFNTYFEIPFTEVFPEGSQNPRRAVEFFTERRRISYLSPDLRWTFQTAIISVDPEGSVYKKGISSEWSGLQFPCEYADEEIVIREIEESLFIPENAYQLFHCKRLNLLGVVVDTREDVMGDPIPTIILLDITDRIGLGEKYRIQADWIFPSECLEVSETDETWDGPEGDVVDPDYWIRQGQFLYTLHGSDESGPQCKVIERENETILIVGTSAVKRVLPVTGEEGDTVNRTTVIRLNEDSAEFLMGSQATFSWNYPPGSGSKEVGPQFVRTIAVTDTKVVFGSDLESSRGLRELD